MARFYQQFLGSKPGILVELLDDTASPYRVRDEDGFEFYVNADDFRSYYRRQGEQTPGIWNHLLTDSDRGFVDSMKMAEVIQIIGSFESVFQDFDKARSFVRNALEILGDGSDPMVSDLQSWLRGLPLEETEISKLDIQRLVNLDQDVKRLLLSRTSAVIPLPTGTREDHDPPFRKADQGKSQSRSEPKSGKQTVHKAVRGGTKNVEMLVAGEILKIRVDLSKEFGPSKSGKTIIVASSEGSRSLPGREEKIGLNVYRQESNKQQKGRRRSFKNVDMDVQGDSLEISIDLSKEFGSSKSGKTVIVASTEGNQLVFGREERLGLNVYKKVE
jgi:hypothetical protein